MNQNNKISGNRVARFSEKNLEIPDGVSLNFRRRYSLFPQLIICIAINTNKKTETKPPQISLEEK